MASNVLTFITVTALACLATVSGSGLVPLPAGVYCTTSNSANCTRYYPNSVCYQEEEVCKYGDQCECITGYAPYSFTRASGGPPEYSCRPANVSVGGWCNNTLGKTCSGYRTRCQQYFDYSICECYNGYTPNADGTDCIPVDLGKACTNGDACGVNAYCDSRLRCRCLPGYKEFNGTDCTHYVPGETCPETECEFHNGPSCGYGTCKNGVFECIPGSRWWQYSTPNGEVPSPLVDGGCLENIVTLVSTGELCSADNVECRSTNCVYCPEQRVGICNGATSSKTISAATSLVLLLACYLFH